jgi:lactoylglutathione lyase
MRQRLLRAAAGGAVALIAAASSPAEQAAQPAADARPAILGIARIAFRVSAMEPARAFYGGVLGLAQITPGPAGTNCVRYRLNDRQDIAIEPGLPADQDERLSFLAFETTSVDALAAHLKAHGVTPEVQPPASACAEATSHALWVKDPDGHPLAFVQLDDRSAKRSGRIGSGRIAISTRLLHAGLTIANVEAADKFYKDVLGFSEIWRGGRTDDVTSWINMKVPSGTDYVEYMLVTGPVNRQQRGVLHHAALLVPDIQIALETSRNRTPSAQRAALASPQVGRNHRWQLNLYDPDGTRIELMEPFTMR